MVMLLNILGSKSVFKLMCWKREKCARIRICATVTRLDNGISKTAVIVGVSSIQLSVPTKSGPRKDNWATGFSPSAPI